MSRKFPEVSFDIRQASVQKDIGIMAVLLTGAERDVTRGRLNSFAPKGLR